MNGASKPEQRGSASRPRPRHGGHCSGDRPTQLRSIAPTALAEYASELLGLDIQAVILARARSARSGGLQAWELTTPHGTFWLVEDGVVAEMFMVASARAQRHPMSTSGVMQAMARFRELHVACFDGGSTVVPARPVGRDPDTTWH